MHAVQWRVMGALCAKVGGRSIATTFEHASGTTLRVTFSWSKATEHNENHLDCCVAAPAVGLVKPTRRRRRPQARRYRAAASWRAAALADVAIASFLTAASDMRVVCTLTGRTDPRGQKRGLFQRFCRGRSWLKKRRKKYFSSGNLFSLHIACACRFGARTFWSVHSGSWSLS